MPIKCERREALALIESRGGTNKSQFYRLAYSSWPLIGVLTSLAGEVCRGVIWGAWWMFVRTECTVCPCRQ
jgi:hypothetical protein